MTAPTPPAELPRTVDAAASEEADAAEPSEDLGKTRQAPSFDEASRQTVIPGGSAGVTAENTGEVPNPDDSQTKTRRLGPFTMGRRLGVGGMGVVYAAKYTKGDRRAVAVKVLTPSLAADPKVRKRFNREMEIFKKLRHPHIVRYFGGGQTGGKLFYAMELLSGGSVEDRLRETGPVDWRRAVDFAAQTADALHHAHAQGVIHRDLKPANLFIDSKGNLKLGDFGIARDANATALTAAGRTVGTYAYMAPEQISSALEVGPKTDLYALGCVLHELLTGRPPFSATNPAKLLHSHMTEPPPRVRSPDCPRWLADLVDSMLAKDPADRPFDALAVRELLRERAEEEATRSVIGRTAAAESTALGATVSEVRTQRDAARKLLGRKKKRKRGPAVPIYERAWFLGLLLVLMAGGATWAMWPPGEEELYDQAAALMASDDVNDWRAARENFIDPLLERFPETEHAPELTAWIDRIEVDILRRQLRTQAASVFASPRNELERQYQEVERLADFGDYWGAADQVNVLRDLLKDNAWTKREEIGADNARYYGLLLDQRAAELESELRDDTLGRQGFVADSLRSAERAFAAGRVGEAREKWTGVVQLYETVPELVPQVEWSRARLAGQSPPPPAFLTEPTAAPEPTGKDEPPPDGPAPSNSEAAE
ncbi:serine/threonine-protein kinase [Alienimonas chondri]|uniref:Serine/threonine-protein kinase PknD n=1 Tax=Alienimonas chondri TaxID=2681879 RepID=A0ABX1VB06_9PLAN|nr:serine/threonine-protein kinase [Alienimonas chondri]NNJ24482.1 Serine/threonine-protein kinase PknD [Alienimonas chondri]